MRGEMKQTQKILFSFFEKENDLSFVFSYNFKVS